MYVCSMLIPLVSSTLWHPAAAAQRKVAARFPGSRTLSQIRVKGNAFPFFFSEKHIWDASGRLKTAAKMNNR